MAPQSVNNPAELEVVLNGILDKLSTLQSESLVNTILAQHVLASAVRRAAEPKKYFEEIRVSSRANIEERTKFEGGDNEGNALARKRALDMHDKIFEELRRALWPLAEPTH